MPRVHARERMGRWGVSHDEFALECQRRELAQIDVEGHPTGALRGLFFAGLLSAPFWIALYLLLR